MQEVKIDRLGIVLPLKFADMTLIADVQDYLDGIRRIKEKPLDEARLTFIIQRACEDGHDPDAFNVSMRHYSDGSVSYTGKCLRLHIEEFAEILNGLSMVYLESLRDRKNALLEKVKGDLTASERAEVRNSVAELERLIKVGQQKSSDAMVSYRLILLEEGPAGKVAGEKEPQKDSSLVDVSVVETSLFQQEKDDIDEEIERLQQQKKQLLAAKLS